MTQKTVIRDETNGDVAVITEVTVAAFATLEISNRTEQFIIQALRSAGALTLSLVAEVDGRVVGHIAFSPVAISDGTKDWYGLGPLSVLPEYQRRGIGKALMQEGLSRLKKLGAKGCCLVGHPHYYKRFGFENVTGLVHEGVPQEVFFALSFDGHFPQGDVMFHEGFKTNGQQGAPADGLPPLTAAFTASVLLSQCPPHPAFPRWRASTSVFKKLLQSLPLPFDPFHGPENGRDEPRGDYGCEHERDGGDRSG